MNKKEVEKINKKIAELKVEKAQILKDYPTQYVDELKTQAATLNMALGMEISFLKTLLPKEQDAQVSDTTGDDQRTGSR